MSTTVNTLNWMSGIAKTDAVQTLSIPGTHESCALYGGGPTQCQALGITDQLRRGIRFLDVRCAHAVGTLGTKELPVYHGGVYQYISFGDVQDECVAFLKENPSEFILMNVQQEMVPNLANRSADAFMETFAGLYDPDYWLFPDALDNLENWQNHIVLIRTWIPAQGTTSAAGWPWRNASASLPGPGLEWNGFDIDGVSQNNLFDTQNGWSAWSNDQDKEAAIKLQLQRAYGVPSPDRIFLNFLSRAAGGWVGTAAQNINDDILTYLQTDLTGGLTQLGVLAMDFAGNTGWGGCLEEEIIRRNRFVAGCTFEFPISPFKLLLGTPNTPMEGWFMAAGQHGLAVIGYPGTPGHPSADEPIIFERYPYGGKDYFKAQGLDQYLSVRDDGQVQLKYWGNSSTFTCQGSTLVSDDNNKPMRTKNSGELWCGDDGALVTVMFAPA